MCGIVGCVAKENCYERIYAALSRLEYRGYDSAGIAMLQEGAGFHLRKKRGYVSNLKGRPLAGEAGIGHTRWATHGKPTDANAHPHGCGKFMLVHNGIIENYLSLKEELCAQGEQFASETDSEVIVKLISRAYTGDFFSAVRTACRRLRGSYAIAVLCSDHPGEVIGARQGSPLVAGASDTALYICSDIPALCGDAEYICPASDGEFICIRDGKIQFFDEAGSELCKCFTRVLPESRAETSVSGTFMEKEIAQIPRAIADTLQGVSSLDYAPCARALRAAKCVYAVACGTAFHAALVFGDVVQNTVGAHVVCTVSSEFRYANLPIGVGDLVVAVSQSGETADTLEAVRLAAKRGAFVIAVTNIAHSTLAALADFSIVMRAGPEIAVAATKSYNCQLVCLYYLAAQMQYFRTQAYPVWFLSLRDLPAAAEAAFDCFPQMSALAAKWKDARGMLFLGRSLDLRTAAEGALKTKEIAYVFAEGYAAGELKHGTLALIEEGFPVVALSTRRDIASKTENALAESKARGAQVVLLSQSEESLNESCADFRIRLPNLPECLMPAVAVIPLQYFACRLCLLRGYDPDKPRNLAKSVTVE